MSVYSDIRDGLRAICKDGSGRNSAFSAEVLAVDIASRSCSVVSISDAVETKYDNVWLMPEINDGILYIPSVGSTVIVQNNATLQPYVCMWSAIDKVMYVVNSTTFILSDGSTVFNGGDNGGLVNVVPLVEKINRLEDLVKELISNYNSHTHQYFPGGGAITPTYTPIPTEANTIPANTTREDIEDTKVTH